MEEYINLKQISERLKVVQERSGLSAKDFCNETQLSQSTFSQIINGKQLINIEGINKVIHKWSSLITPQWFLFGQEYQEQMLSSHGENPLTAETSEGSQWRQVLLQQAEELAHLRAQLQEQKTKSIDHITIFYTDNSFATFTLSEGQ